MLQNSSMVLDGNTRALLGKNRTDLNLKVLQDFDPMTQEAILRYWILTSLKPSCCCVLSKRVSSVRLDLEAVFVIKLSAKQHLTSTLSCWWCCKWSTALIVVPKVMDSSLSLAFCLFFRWTGCRARWRTFRRPPRSTRRARWARRSGSCRSTPSSRTRSRSTKSSSTASSRRGRSGGDFLSLDWAVNAAYLSPLF